MLEIGRDHQLCDRALLDQRLVQARPALAGLAAEPRGEIALRVGVDGEHASLGRGQARGEVDGGGGLADAAFLVGYRDGASQGPSLPPPTEDRGSIARRPPRSGPITRRSSERSGSARQAVALAHGVEARGHVVVHEAPTRRRGRARAARAGTPRVPSTGSSRGRRGGTGRRGGPPGSACSSQRNSRSCRTCMRSVTCGCRPSPPKWPSPTSRPKSRPSSNSVRPSRAASA